MYATNSAQFEITEIGNSSKCIMTGKYVGFGGGGTLTTYNSVRGEGCPRIDEIARTYLLNGP